MAKSRFRVIGRLDRAASVIEGTVTIDRTASTFEVRPLRRRKTYTVDLGQVATMVCQKLLQAEARERKKARDNRRRRTKRRSLGSR